MNNQISNSFIRNSISQLINIFGIKEDVHTAELTALLNKGNVKQCIKKIALYLGLNINIELSYVSKDYNLNNASKFDSNNQITKTDWRGQGIGSITAQVAVPESLPLYGTPSLTNYPIRVRVSEDCKEYPKTFIAVMAHELSHVLLHSLHNTRWDNEIYADLTPMILGFINVVGNGRKVTEETNYGIFRESTTTTYGYLTDSQFDFACGIIREKLGKYRQKKQKVLKQTTKIRKLLSSIEKNLFKFKKYLEYLDEHHDRTIKGQDISKIVQFHFPDYSRKYEEAITDGKERLVEIEGLCKNLIHYTESVLRELQDYDRKLKSLIHNLVLVSCSLRKDTKVLSRNVSFVYLLKVVFLGNVFRRNAKKEELNKEQSKEKAKGEVKKRSWRSGYWKELILGLLILLLFGLLLFLLINGYVVVII